MIVKPRSIAVIVVAILNIVVSGAALSSDATGSVDLLADASRSVSIVENKTASAWQKSLVFEESGKHAVAFRAVFQVENPTCLTSLVLKKPLNIENLTLNGKAIPTPIKGMTYQIIPGIPVSLLEKGSNELQATWTQEIKSQKDEKTSMVSIVPGQLDAADVGIRLFELTPSALTFQTGPVLGYASKNFFTVTCRVNIPAEAVLEVNGRKYVSKPALLHSFNVDGLEPDTLYHYSLKARLSSKGDTVRSVGPYPVRTLPTGGQFSFAVLGDSRTDPKAWAKVAASVVTAKPAFTVFVGDMVANGRIDSQWDEQYFGPAKDYFATIPCFAVIGNHEGNCPLFTRIFPTPGGKNWSQEIGSVLLIGIDGAMDWTSKSDLARWLEDTLAKSKAKFIFLASHYPAWTLGRHGKLKNGRPQEKSVRLAQDV
ncbi:MAG: metallophosphoesterase, partial [Verrucomicrobia bacterium]|nr:metallophosphoesterase [Verrucomicrobiota bacterium]